ncbi:MAG: hypothetical protein IT322_19435 [Anaerolineae bacterium]|nr:hypothetical protein [Anaerolineae bacterium]
MNQAEPLPVPFDLHYRAGITLHGLEGMSAAAQESLGTQTDPTLIALETARLSGIHFILGEGLAASEQADRALGAAQALNKSDLLPYWLCLKAAILGYQGRYQESEKAFAQAEKLFNAAGDPMGNALRGHLFAREYLRDQRQFAKAFEYLSVAFQVLRAKAPPALLIENLLTQADCLIHQAELRRTREVLSQAETMINDQRSGWYKPELLICKSNLALIEGDTRNAIKFCREGLGLIGDTGDLRTLSALYLTLGAALERNKAREDDIRDALERAITTARARSRKLHLALSIRQMGLHLRRNNIRSTVRAKGGGYLFEAEQMLNEMKLIEHFPMSGTSSSSQQIL